MEARIKAIEEGLKSKAAQLKEVVEKKAEKLGDKSPSKRRNIIDIFSSTLPDPVEAGVAADLFAKRASDTPGHMGPGKIDP
ncbi:hypothetical protein J3R84_29185 (plasmid) [Ensifer canadensis]|nr:hypothetical protein [Sinorhizobium medicae]MDX0961855.1 hypothetical protein [Sinorhizobium medicae]PLU63448.1 hypothetical protein BMJ22_29280 [Sinorhizobium medicae]UBI79476.1 hypothetical protein J3R84_29185 [Ensifer canadensis]